MKTKDVTDGYYWVRVGSKHHSDFGTLTVIKILKYKTSSGEDELFMFYSIHSGIEMMKNRSEKFEIIQRIEQPQPMEVTG